MKKILLIVILLFAISISVNAFDFSKLLFESAIETDRYQSYNWYFSTKENPVVLSNGDFFSELNPLISGTDRQEFDNIVNVTKMAVNNIPYIFGNKIGKNIYLLITLAEIYNVYRNNQIHKNTEIGEYWTLSYSWQF